MDILKCNSATWDSATWDRNVERGIEWTLPVDADAIAAARRGQSGVWLTDETPARIAARALKQA